MKTTIVMDGYVVIGVVQHNPDFDVKAALDAFKKTKRNQAKFISRDEAMDFLRSMGVRVITDHATLRMF